MKLHIRIFLLVLIITIQGQSCLNAGLTDFGTNMFKSAQEKVATFLSQDNNWIFPVALVAAVPLLAYYYFKPTTSKTPPALPTSETQSKGSVPTIETKANVTSQKKPSSQIPTKQSLPAAVKTPGVYPIPPDALAKNKLKPLMIKNDYGNEEEKMPLSHIGKRNGTQRTMYQFSTLDQFDLGTKHKIDYGACSIFSLYNATNLNDFARTNDPRYLLQLNNSNTGATFMKQFQQTNFLDVDTLKKHVKDNTNISVIGNIALLNESLTGFATTDEINEAQTVKKRLLEKVNSQQDFFHSIIFLKNPINTPSHYATFSIIKSNNRIQYIVLDSAPGSYYLEKNSYEYTLLQFMIDNFEEGSSKIQIVNEMFKS